MQQWKYVACRDCEARAYAYAQHPTPYALQVAVRCVDGQDGLCHEHRTIRRHQRFGWSRPIPEGQE
jgi:hypothetical protein